MDYRAFLPARDPVVLPYFGGTRVDAADRRLRVDGALAPGWWRFRIDGRRAVPIERAPAPDSSVLAALPIVRGHWVAGWVVASGRELGRVALPPDDEPIVLARVSARRWHSGELLLASVDFEDDAELAARHAFEQRQPLGEIRGVVPSLRAAFGYALGLAVARAQGVEVAVRELTPHVVAIADGGAPAALARFADLVARRAREIEAAVLRAQDAALVAVAGTARVRDRARTPHQRADDALEGASARMLDCRAMAAGEQLDVTYEVDGTRIHTLVRADTLQVLDPGVCLSGAHRILTLDAMPSVIREAIADDVLNITRFA